MRSVYGTQNNENAGANNNSTLLGYKTAIYTEKKKKTHDLLPEESNNYVDPNHHLP